MWQGIDIVISLRLGNLEKAERWARTKENASCQALGLELPTKFEPTKSEPTKFEKPRKDPLSNHLRFEQHCRNTGREPGQIG